MYVYGWCPDGKCSLIGVLCRGTRIVFYADLSVNHSIHVFCIELDGGDGDARQMVGGELLRRPLVLRVPRPIAALRLRQVLPSVDVGHELWAASSVDLDDGE